MMNKKGMFSITELTMLPTAFIFTEQRVKRKIFLKIKLKRTDLFFQSMTWYIEWY